MNNTASKNLSEGVRNAHCWMEKQFKRATQFVRTLSQSIPNSQTDIFHQ